MSLLRAIIQGQPGSGKTSLLAAAANANYEILLQDYDQCADPIFAYTTLAGKSHIHMNTAPAIEKLESHIQKAKTRGAETIFAIDSLSELAPIVEERVASLNTNTDPRMLIWQTGKTMEELCRKLKRLPCHVIVISHLRLISPHVESGYVDRGGQYRGQDTPLQRQVKLERAKLEETSFCPNIPSENVARNFVHLFPFALLVEEDGAAKNASGRVVRTRTVPGFQIKCPIAGIADKLPIETALLTLLAGVGDELALATLAKSKAA